MHIKKHNWYTLPLENANYQVCELGLLILSPESQNNSLSNGSASSVSHWRPVSSEQKFELFQVSLKHAYSPESASQFTTHLIQAQRHSLSTSQPQKAVT